ncbi:2-phytyl-1,4-beta-naphthoquinone methyltransferase, chloroplastic isoform X1 [Triticum aestivum]|uniref:2-phytyl-1,4-beta-naphthoquinone methyltransferase, chloroplastic isoform X1 n=1 Tax=Triticum aestivum TaxID=4565 RepID=UPI001D01EC15|nr:2-phytyl-1,4-beta-naphthoquinone methyltransferase, chloroplastic-like isoform X1 [Triticum aestivum]
MSVPPTPLSSFRCIGKYCTDDSAAVPRSLQLNDVLSLGQHRTWKRICVSWSMYIPSASRSSNVNSEDNWLMGIFCFLNIRAKRGDRVLDLCCGSGDLAFLLSQKVGLDGEVMGVDFSGQQLQTAASRQDQRWKACYKNIKWIEGDALDLPFTDRYFDAVTVGYGLRNVVDRPKAMREILRVLKPGSRASVLDFNKSSSFFTASLQSWAIDNVVVPLASSYGLTEEYKYLKSSISQYLTGEELEKLAKEAGFSSAKHYELGGGLMGNLVATR